MKNPWGERYDQSALMRGCITCDAESRIQQIRESADVAWLLRVAKHRGNQKSVQQAVEARILKLDRAYRPGCAYHGCSGKFSPVFPKPLGQMCYECPLACARKANGEAVRQLNERTSQ